MAAPVEKGNTIQCLMHATQRENPSSNSECVKGRPDNRDNREKRLIAITSRFYSYIFSHFIIYKKQKRINIFDEINGIVFVFGVYLQPALAEAAHAVAKATTNPSIFGAVFKDARH